MWLSNHDVDSYKKPKNAFVESVKVKCSNRDYNSGYNLLSSMITLIVGLIAICACLFCLM